MKVISDFATTLRNIRKSKSMSIRSLSEISGVSHSYLSQVENGTRDTPSPEIIKKIAAALNYDYFTLMRLAGHMTIKTGIDYSVEDLINKASDEYKKRFLTDMTKIFDTAENNEETKSIKQSINGVDLNEFKENLKADSKEWINIHFERFFKRHGRFYDYIALLQDYSNLTLNELAKRAEIPFKELIRMIKEDEVPEVTTLEKIGQAFGMDNIYEWFKKETNCILYDEDLNEILSHNKKVKITFEVDAYAFGSAINASKYLYRVSEEELRKRFFTIDYLLGLENENVYFKNRILTNKQKSNVLRILEILFEDQDVE